MATDAASLWRQTDFLRLWASQAIGQIGAQIGFLALPLTAAVALDATPGQMGMLTAVGALPTLLIGLHSGAAIDRRDRRPVLIAADIGGALLLACVPLAWLAGVLTMELLYLIAFGTGALALIAAIAHQAFLPVVVPRERLVDANGKMALGTTAAEVVGPALGGVLVQVLSAPVAVAADAASRLLSALTVAGIRTPEPCPDRRGDRPGMWHDILDGLRLALGEPRLRALIGSRALLNLFNAMLESVFVLYVVRELGIGAVTIGVIFSVGSVGFLLGALLPVRLANALGVGPSMVLGIVVLAVSDLLVPLAGGPTAVVIALLALAQLLFGLGITVFNVHQASLRQALVPGGFLGRVGSTVRVLGDALTPLGALLGGGLGAAIGLRETLILAAAGELLAALWLWRSPLRYVTELPGHEGVMT